MRWAVTHAASFSNRVEERPDTPHSGQKKPCYKVHHPLDIEDLVRKSTSWIPTDSIECGWAVIRKLTNFVGRVRDIVRAKAIKRLIAKHQMCA